MKSKATPTEIAITNHRNCKLTVVVEPWCFEMDLDGGQTGRVIVSPPVGMTMESHGTYQTIELVVKEFQVSIEAGWVGATLEVWRENELLY